MGLGNLFRKLMGRNDPPGHIGEGLEEATRKGLEESFARVYHLELVLEDEPVLYPEELLADLQSKMGRVEWVNRPKEGEAWSGNMLLFYFHTHPVQVGGSYLPYQLMVMLPSTAGITEHQRKNFEEALTQPQDWAEAGAAIALGRHTVLMNDIMSSGMPPVERMACFQGAAHAVVKCLRPVAVYNQWCQRILNPALYLELHPGHPAYHPGLFSIHVRHFQLAYRPGTYVMDTMGLAALGVPDVQIMYRDLPDDALANHVFGIGMYLFEQGDIVRDGETMQGLEAGQRWPCRHGLAEVGPVREVLQLDSGQV